MILKEDLGIPALDKEFKNNYSKDFADEPNPEQTFLKIVKLDPSSFPKNDMTLEPNRVGQIAGGNGLLIRCWRNGDRAWINNEQTCQQITQAAMEFLTNRGKFAIKNPAGYTSVQNFIDVVLNGAQVSADQANQTNKKQKQTPDEKLEGLRVAQFNYVPDLNTFKNLCDIDFDSDVEHGTIGKYARSIILPACKNSTPEQMAQFISHKNAYTKKFINYDALGFQAKEEFTKELGANYNLEKLEEVLNSYFTSVRKTNLFDLLNYYGEEGKDYKIVARNKNYDVIVAYTWYATQCVDNYPAPPGTITPQSNGGNSGKWFVNHWCTGYGNNFFYTYQNNGQAIYYDFISTDYSGVTPDGLNSNWVSAVKHKNFQGNLFKSDSHFGQLLNGYDDWAGQNELLAVLKDKSNLDLLCQLLKDPYLCRNESHVIPAVKYYESQGIKVTAKSVADFQDVDEEPFVYKGHASMLAFENGALDKSTVGELIIEEGVTNIPAGEFEDFTSLMKIKFPSTLKKIGAKAFARCTSLAKIKLPENLEVIGLGAFDGCKSLGGSIRLPISIREIHAFAFAHHNISKGLSFTISPKIAQTGHDVKLPSYPEEEAEWWRTAGRIKRSDN